MVVMYQLCCGLMQVYFRHIGNVKLSNKRVTEFNSAPYQIPSPRNTLGTGRKNTSPPQDKEKELTFKETSVIIRIR